MRKLAALFCIFLATLASAQVSLPPIQGYGAGATGGSTVYHITSTATGTGAGTLGGCFSATGHHCVFDVGGTFTTSSSNNKIPSNTWLDCFSAPSRVIFTGGVGNEGILDIWGQSSSDEANVIVQGCTIRVASVDNTKGIMIYATNSNTHDIVLDHNEIENNTDEDIGFSGSGPCNPGKRVYNVTISYNLLGGPASSGGMLVKYCGFNGSVHHNLWSNLSGNDTRIPLFWAGDDTTTADSPAFNNHDIADLIGNVAGSNWTYGITIVNDGAIQNHSDIINNFQGVSDDPGNHDKNALIITETPLEQHYIAGNAMINNPVQTTASYGCGASNLCTTFPTVKANTITCTGAPGCQPTTPFAFTVITTSCPFDVNARIAEWNNVIATAGVVLGFADDSTATTLRNATSVPRPTTTILNQAWNQQSGTCAAAPPAPPKGLILAVR